MTNRLSNHDHNKAPGTPNVSDFSKFKVHDSYRIPTTDTTDSGSPEAAQRISQKRLQELSMLLSPQDRDILLSVQRHRYLMTGQIMRLHFTDAATSSAALRATSRTLKRLRQYRLLGTLSRRIGGVRAGSGSLVWYLTHGGERLLRLYDERAYPCRRIFDPSPFFLAHTLAAAEVSIRLQEMCRGGKIELTDLQPEPECWRSYSEHGTHLSLKPDLYATTVSGEYEDRYFFEIDLDTESPGKVVEKCQRYHQYYHSGLEQKEHGVFPLTIWIVPDKARRARLIAAIRAAFDKQPRLFAVITGDELARLIQCGGDKETLC